MSTFSREYCPKELKLVTDFKHGFRSYKALYKVAADLAINQTWAEFGVGCGHNTTRHLRNYLSPDGNLYLFDSWEGIPEPMDWSDTNVSPIGSWKFPSSVGVKLKEIDNRLIITDGLFKDTLPKFSFPEQLGLVQIDCDIYSSTRDVLYGADAYLDTGTVMIFDELIGYQNYKEHEYKALQEWLEDTGREIEWHAKESFACVGVIA